MQPAYYSIKPVELTNILQKIEATQSRIEFAQKQKNIKEKAKENFSKEEETIIKENNLLHELKQEYNNELYILKTKFQLFN